jgi:hypothetical protein
MLYSQDSKSGLIPMPCNPKRLRGKTQTLIVLSAQVGGMKSVRPPSMQIRFLKIVTGVGARYPGIKEEVMTALIKSSLESNWSISKAIGDSCSSLYCRFPA